ncbi:apolipoprotein N-acyltransferase [Ramlibacter sp. AW1]|uniref:Apolipoprotein N-acyltransferase n=1 Tax=Ramlibacter aurantiacus TaxID=2801330 RepID=A0A937D6P1_9BURK|nr:apolipoprotein N-acyltransferase [Ramlibacter aurantiacus]MBL0420066.1 apolipoprotein N-acyltransferase [Ramlibacter aurantiacus]
MGGPRLRDRPWAGIVASALLCALYAHGGAAWLLGFVAFVPWLRTLDTSRSLPRALLGAWALSVGYTAAVLGWFASAISGYLQVGTATGWAVLLLGAPLLQPQFLAFALVRHLVGRRHGAVLRAFAAVAAWIATEAFVPRLLGDTFGIGLYPSRLFRQAADLGGVAGLTAVLLLVNEALACALARRRLGWRALATPLAGAALGPLLLAGHGLSALADPPPTGPLLRVALVQSNIVDYERLRRERGAAAVVHEVLDTHGAMSWDAVERQRADAVLWSETVYPTTFGRPKSEAGAELDREILGMVEAAGVPFVFGTYERDAAGEYNAAAFVAPGAGLVGFYRKSRPFPLTEYVPPWLDGPLLRRWLPWAGTWQPGTGARVLPLRLRGGREVPVLPMICLDDMDTGLAVAGARLGAQAILTLSNDSWFTHAPQGARLHLAAAAFRSIETRLPQFRVTTNGYSAVIHPDGSVLAAAAMGERSLVVGELPVHAAPPTLLLAWGDWLGPAAALFLLLLAAASLLRRWPGPAGAGSTARAHAPVSVPRRVAVLPPAARLAAGLLRGFARLGLLGMAAALLLGDAGWQGRTLATLQTFTLVFLAPELAAWLVLRAYTANAAIEHGVLVLARGRHRLDLRLADIAAAEAWRVPLPRPGTWLRLRSGQRWPFGLALADTRALATALGIPGPPDEPASRLSAYAGTWAAIRRAGRLAHPMARFVGWPMLLAIPAFRLHQHILYGSGLGEYHEAGLQAYVTGFLVWWAAWIVGMVLYAAVLRTLIEAGTFAAAVWQPVAALDVRRWVERIGLLAFYLGPPAWLLLLTA